MTELTEKAMNENVKKNDNADFCLKLALYDYICPEKGTKINVIEGFSDCFVGVSEEDNRLIYSARKILEKAELDKYNEIVKENS